MTTENSPSPETQALADELPRSYEIPSAFQGIWDKMRLPQDTVALDQTVIIEENPHKRRISPIHETRRKSLRLAKREIEKAELLPTSDELSKTSLLDGNPGSSKRQRSPVTVMRRRSSRLAKNSFKPELDLIENNARNEAHPKAGAMKSPDDEEEEEVVAILAKGQEGRFVFYKVVFAGDADADAVWLKKSALGNCKGLIRMFEKINKT